VNQNIRLVVFVVVAFAILFGFNMWVGPKSAPPTSTAQVPVATSVSAVPTALPALAPSSAKAQAPKPSKVVEAAPADVVIDTPLYSAVLSNHGANIRSFELKNYKNRTTQKPLDLVSGDTDSPKPLDVAYAPAGDLAGRNWEVVGGARRVTLKKGEKTVVVFRIGTGLLTVEKTIRLDADQYIFDVDVTVKQIARGSVPTGSLVVESPSDLGHEEFTGTSSRASGFRCATYAAESMDTEKPKRSQEGKDVPAPVVWAALADQFYVAAILPDQASGSASVAHGGGRLLQFHL